MPLESIATFCSPPISGFVYINLLANKFVSTFYILHCNAMLKRNCCKEITDHNLWPRAKFTFIYRGQLLTVTSEVHFILISLNSKLGNEWFPRYSTYGTACIVYCIPLLALLTPVLNGVNFPYAALKGPALKGPALKGPALKGPA